ncbi:MAG TPA: hypothetical protein VGK74_08540 [Symbiobacteriaceae bacterium]|jgi:hypothetical protein
MRMTRLERTVVWNMSGGRCYYCGRKIGREQPEADVVGREGVPSPFG